MYNVTLIPGDGTGPELAEATRKCLDATGVKIKWDVQECGIEVIEKAQGKVPDSVLASIRSQTKIALKAPITTPIGKGFRSVNVVFKARTRTVSPAFVRAKAYPGVRTYFRRRPTSISWSSAKTPRIFTRASSSKPDCRQPSELIQVHQQGDCHRPEDQHGSRTRPESASSRFPSRAARNISQVMRSTTP